MSARGCLSLCVSPVMDWKRLLVSAGGQAPVPCDLARDVAAVSLMDGCCEVEHQNKRFVVRSSSYFFYPKSKGILSVEARVLIYNK